MKRKSSKPFWYAKVCELNRWQKNLGVYMLSGHTAQIVFIDLTDPIGIMLQRPLKLNRDEGIITGTFMLNMPQVKDKKIKAKPYYIVAVYNPRAKAFMYSIPGEHLPHVLSHPEIRYISGEERERARATLRLESQPI